MNESVHQLLQSLLEKNSIEECNLQDLQNIAKQYPYFAPIQLILSEKMKSQHPSLYQKQLQKTSLYFHNVLWFDYLLNRDEYPREESIITMPVEQQEQTEPSAYDDQMEEQIINTEEWITLEEKGEETIQDNSVPHQESFISLEEAHSDVQHIDYGEGPIEKKDAINMEENGKEEIQFFGETRTEQEPESPTSDIEKIDEYESPGEPTEITGIHLDIKMPELKQTAQSESETALAFEPYHTIDYFASQGIKLSADEKSGDRLGQQLRSFTEWLKTMKKLPQSEIAKKLDSGLELKVQTLAEHSLETPEVMTEAMAEVWEKQGNHEKAVETYNKLSLLNPAKSAYFAAKIEQLKKEN